MSDVSSQININTMQMNSLVMQGLNNISSNTRSGKTNSNADVVTNIVSGMQKAQNMAIYAVEGDAKYDKEIDSDSNGIITYNEYVKYLSTQRIENSNSSALRNLARFAASEDSETGAKTFTITDVGKSLRSYINNYLNRSSVESIISAEA